MFLPSSIVKVDNERVISKLLKSFVMMAIHITCARRENISKIKGSMVKQIVVNKRHKYAIYSSVR